ncbi:lipase [Formosa sp. PL04]|uniref:lipase n=1 Tax=Formosa sp. PL04 TaxID=3081755 RepID=UPI002981ED37|nr:lipase [Formosa sp. PL04]MDW5289862.1 lipase [Formosa sp. PL04]
MSTAHTLPNGKSQDGFSLLGTTIKYPTAASFWMIKTNSKDKIKSVDSIVNNIEVLIDSDIEETPVSTKKEAFVPKIPNLSKIDTSKVERISYPKNKAEFIAHLKEQLTSSQCRIVHYGDSQIEGDRISSYIRNKIQDLYGGNGPGFTPVSQVYENISAVVTTSKNWTRHAAFDPSAKRFEHKKYGAYTTLSRFTPYYNIIADSIHTDTLKLVKATITIQPSTKTYSRMRNYTNIGFHYGNSQLPVSVKVFADGSLIKETNLIADGNYHDLRIKLAEAPTELTFKLEGKMSPDVYGLTLDGNEGISLDNVAMRGSAGTVFAGLNSENFTQMYNGLNPKVLIFQYGGNSVPYVKDSLEVEQYVGYLKNHINWVRRKTNNASVIYIGPADMTTTENGQMKTYPLLPYLINRLRQMCYDNNIAYWSTFNAMGGENSMQHWVDQDLAASDYTHFSLSGTRIISELFFLSLYMDLINK